jgi:membrane protease YdiL (CAAX protease family)
MRSAIERHPVVSFFLFACAFSWILWGLMLASQRGALPFAFPVNWSGSFGPFAGAVVTAAVLGGKRGLRDLLGPVFRARFAPGWYFFVLVGCVLLFAVALVVYALLGKDLAFDRQVARNGLAQLPLYYVIIFFAGGPLGEEIGWRGFALPRLLERRGRLGASLVVAVMWFIWHVPLFWIEGAAQKGSSIPVFAILVLANAVIFTWVYVGSGRSLLSVLLLHASINTWSYLFSEAAPALDRDALLGWLIAGVFAAVAAVIAAFWRRRPA